MGIEEREADTGMRRGKTRLAKWYAPYNDEEKIKLKGEVCYSFFSSSLHFFPSALPSSTPSNRHSPLPLHLLAEPVLIWLWLNRSTA